MNTLETVDHQDLTGQVQIHGIVPDSQIPGFGTRPTDVPAYLWQQLQNRLPDLDQEVEAAQVLTWNITNWRSLDQKMTSPAFFCGGYEWKVLLFPRGNTSPNEVVSIYLEYAGPKTSNDWYACAQFAIILSNPNDPTNHVFAHARHRFIQNECDWGFTRFADLQRLFQPNDHQGMGIIENNNTTLTAFVRVLKDPTGVLWHNFVDYDSKKVTGYVGLHNQGATGYINIILQLWYSIRSMRTAVYQIPTENHLASQSTALALQRIFYFLYTSDRPVSTQELTKSFGWNSLDSYIQKDVQEFNRVFTDKFETLMKGTAAEGAINRLTAGKMKSYIRCVNVDFESSRSEEFYDVNLQVYGIRNLRDSFLDYIAVDNLEGDLGYQTGFHGLQDAQKGVVFQSFPPVFHIQLKRHRYDAVLNSMVTVYDRFEYPLEIDLEEFLDHNADRSEPHIYRLHSVIVLSGVSPHARWVSFIKPHSQTRWLKFDNARVTPATEKEALDGNYGVTPNDVLSQHQHQQTQLKKVNVAHLLVYIRKSKLEEVLGAVTPAEIPPHLRNKWNA